MTKFFLILQLFPIQPSMVTSHNLGQRVVDKFTKLSQISISVECFTAVFLQFFTGKRQNLVFEWVLAIKYKHYMDFHEIF